MEHCNACNADVEDVGTHIKSAEHLKKIEEVKNKFKSKAYGKSRTGLGV